jgi:hypothetical protein
LGCRPRSGLSTSVAILLATWEGLPDEDEDSMAKESGCRKGPRQWWLKSGTAIVLFMQEATIIIT